MNQEEEPRYTFWDLLDDGQVDVAADHLRDHLIAEPKDVAARAMLALCYLDLNRLRDAEVEARQAVAEGPEAAFTHLALGAVHARKDDWIAAAGEGRRVVQLDPHCGDGYALSARAALAKNDAKGALTYCEQGLIADPGHPALANLQALALQASGDRPEEAAKAWEAILERSPADATAVAGRAWLALDRGDRKDAQAAFRTALDLDPTNQWAREGLATSLKARSPVYRALYGFFDWMEHQSRLTRFVVLYGAWLLVRNLPSLTAATPALAPFATGFVVFYAGFVLLTWVGPLVFDGFLLFDTEGRRLVEPKRRVAAAAVTGQLLLALAVGITGAIVDSPTVLTIGLMLGLALLPLANWLQTKSDIWGAISLAVYVAALVFGVGYPLVNPANAQAVTGYLLLGLLLYNLTSTFRGAVR